jgi:hypothetical protein
VKHPVTMINKAPHVSQEVGDDLIARLASYHSSLHERLRQAVVKYVTLSETVAVVSPAVAGRSCWDARKEAEAAGADADVAFDTQLEFNLINPHRPWPDMPMPQRPLPLRECMSKTRAADWPALVPAVAVSPALSRAADWPALAPAVAVSPALPRDTNLSQQPLLPQDAANLPQQPLLLQDAAKLPQSEDDEIVSFVAKVETLADRLRNGHRLSELIAMAASVAMPGSRSIVG